VRPRRPLLAFLFLFFLPLFSLSRVPLQRRSSSLSVHGSVETASTNRSAHRALPFPRPSALVPAPSLLLFIGEMDFCREERKEAVFSSAGKRERYIPLPPTGSKSSQLFSACHRRENSNGSRCDECMLRSRALVRSDSDSGEHCFAGNRIQNQTCEKSVAPRFLFEGQRAVLSPSPLPLSLPSLPSFSPFLLSLLLFPSPPCSPFPPSSSVNSHQSATQNSDSVVSTGTRAHAIG
jgi:hypothetical protein